MDPDVEKSALLSSSSSSSISDPADEKNEDERTPILESPPVVAPKKRKYVILVIIFFLILLLIPAAIFCAYTYQHAWLQPAFHLFGINPGPTTSFDADASIRLHPEQHVYRKEDTIYHHWHVRKEKRAPDGVERDVFLINGQFPGPTLEARSGDTLIIEVHNEVPSSDDENGITIHWHGLHMRDGQNPMDGVAAFTQSCIQFGNSFIYNFTIDPLQSGTFWYHAHSEVQRGDGMFGGLVIHKPAADSVSEEMLYGYQEEVLLMVGDWYHRPAKELLAGYLEGTGNGNEHRPASVIINGVGKFDCSMANFDPTNPVKCTDVAEPWLQVDPKKKYRYRVINVANLYEFTLSLAGSNSMTVVQVDGGQHLKYPYPASSAGILYPGERMDIIVEWGSAQDDEKDFETSLVVTLERPTMNIENPALSRNQSFSIRSHPLSTTPSTSSTNSTLFHFDETPQSLFNLSNAISPNLLVPFPQKADKEITLTTRLEPIPISSTSSSPNTDSSLPAPHGTKGLLNITSWAPQSSPLQPLITLPRDQWDINQFIPWTGPDPIWVDLLVHNLDPNGHPFHLHGFDFYVLEMGLSNLNIEGEPTGISPSSEPSPSGSALNLINPRKKDTVQIPGHHFVRLRFYADNEGIWTFHCHVLWHQGVGMTMGVQILGDERGVFANLREAASSSMSSLPASTGIEELENEKAHDVEVTPETPKGTEDENPAEEQEEEKEPEEESVEDKYAGRPEWERLMEEVEEVDWTPTWDNS